MPVLGTLAAASAEGFGFARPFSPRDLFIGGAVGAWYDPGDISTLFQDSARTTAVTTLGQPVGSILDKSGRANHLTIAADAGRPTWEARVNQLQRTEQLDNAAWGKIDASITANATTAPDGTTTADKVVVNTNSVVTRHEVQQGFWRTIAAGTLVQFTFYAKKSEITKVIGQLAGTAVAAEIEFDLNAGTSTQVYVSNVSNVAHSITALSDNWYLCKLEAKSTSANPINRVAVFHDSIGNGTNGWFLWGCDARLVTDAAYPYQRVVSATDYSDVGSPRYLLFDGVDDRMATPAVVNLSTTNKITVVAGVLKLRDTISGSNTIGMVIEQSVASPSNNGCFYLAAPDTLTSPGFRYSAFSRGTSGNQVGTASTSYNATITNVITMVSNIGAPSLALRANGTQVASSTASQGTGNFSGSHSFFVGARSGLQYIFQGNLYQLIVYGDAASGNTLNDLERWVASRTGVSW